MLKRFDARLWTMGAMVPMILAGCSTTTPTATKVAPAAQPAQPAQAAPVKYSVQGGQDLSGAYMSYAANPCGECPASVPALGAGVLVSPFALWTFDYLSAHPLLDYSWYYARGNFAAFGWAPGFYSNLGNFLWYPTATGYWPYSYSAGAAAYLPYSAYAGGAPIYPYLGLQPYAGLAYGTGLAAPVLATGYGAVPSLGYDGYPGKNGHPGDAQAYANGKGQAYGNGKDRGQAYGMDKDRGRANGQAYGRANGQAQQQRNGGMGQAQQQRTGY